MIETERRFLLKYIPEILATVTPVLIEDYMILDGKDHPHLRLRRKDDHLELTKKYRKNNEGDKLEMIEETIILEEQEFSVFKKLENKSQIKHRYKFTEGNHTAELDLWLGELKGLGIVEFEFSSRAEAVAFTPPDYCLTEVTEDEWLAGGKISGLKYKDLEKGLAKLGYTKLEY